MLRQPGFKDMLGILLSRKNHDETRKVSRRDVCPQYRCRHTIIQPCRGMRTAINHPRVSTSRCRLRPFFFFPPSYPRSVPPTSVVLTAWLSMHAALGVGSRPTAMRFRSRKTGTTRVQVPSARHWEK
jgi:hypothetical protein